jgi:putative inorganic carbon (HCO3(-)) transporter
MSTLVIRESTTRPIILSGLLTGYVALLPYQFEVTRGLNFAPADVFLVLTIVLAGRQLRYSKPAWSFWHFAIAGTLAMGSFVAVLRFGKLEQYEFLNKDAGLLLPFLSYAAVTSCIADWDDLRRILRVFTLSVVLENIVAVAAFLLAYFFGLPNPFARYGGLRLSGVLLDPNAYGGLLVAAFVICEGASWGRARLFQPATLWICRVTLALGILFTFSRSAWVALATALALLAAQKIRLVLRLIVASVIGAAGLFVLMGHRFIPIFEVMASRPKQVQGRFDLIHDALAEFSSHPFVGGGIGNFRLAEGEVAHNTAMWFLADFGIVGLIVLLGFLGWFFVKGWHAYRVAPVRVQPLVLGLLLAHAAMLGLAMGIEAFYQRHWWLVFGLIASSYSLALRRTNDLHHDYRGAW